MQQGETLATVESNESLQTYPVTSPLNDVITARAANTGEQAADKSLFTVADLSSVWVELSLFPRDVAKVRVGTVSRAVAAKLAEINKTLPRGVTAEAVYDRTNLVEKTIATVQKTCWKALCSSSPSCC